MKKGINVFWIGLVLLCASLVLLSRVNCAQFVAASVNRPMHPDMAEQAALPDPVGYDSFEVVWRFCAGCVVAFLFRNVFFNVIGNIIALIQAMMMCFYVQILTALGSTMHGISCNMGGVNGYYEMLPMGYVLSGLSILVFVYSVLLTAAEIRTKREQRCSTV